VKGVGPFYKVVSAPSPDSPTTTIRLGVRHETVEQYLNAQTLTTMAQLVDIVFDHLEDAVHLFRGLQRPLCDGEDMNADKNVLVYVIAPEFDVAWVHAADGGYAVKLEPPPNRVFVALVRMEEGLPDGVQGTIEHWNWVHADRFLKDAPVGHGKRYSEKVWSR